MLRKVKRAGRIEMADVMNVGWKSVECGGRLGEMAEWVSVDARVDEKAGEEGPAEEGWQRVEGKRLAFCCLLLSGRGQATGQACRGLGRPCQRPLAGMAGLVAQ